MNRLLIQLDIDVRRVVRLVGLGSMIWAGKLFFDFAKIAPSYSPTTIVTVSRDGTIGTGNNVPVFFISPGQWSSLTQISAFLAMGLILLLISNISLLVLPKEQSEEKPTEEGTGLENKSK